MPGLGPVDRDEIIKGFEISKGSYVLLDGKEIAAVKIERKRTLELVQFVDAREIDLLYWKSLTSSFLPIRLRRRPTSYCARPCGNRGKTVWVSWRCAVTKAS